MRWLVEVRDIVADERLFTDLLSRLNLTLHQEDSKTYLTGDEFERLSTSAEVWEQAKRLRDVVTEVNNGIPGANISFKLGDIQEQREDGSQGTYVLLTPTSIVSTTAVGVCGVTVIPMREITEEERVRLEAERKEHEYQEKFDLISSRVVSAYQDKRARKVQHFLEQDLTAGSMYKIYELIRDDLGEKLNSLASDKQWTRFTRSVNHQEVFGDDARHATLKAEPPTNPMSLGEAQDFIKKVSDLWFKQKYADYTAIAPKKAQPTKNHAGSTVDSG